MEDYKKAKYIHNYTDKEEIYYNCHIITDYAIYYKADKFIKIENFDKKKPLCFNLQPLFKEFDIGCLTSFSNKNQKDELLLILYSSGKYHIYSLIFEKDCVKYKNIYEAKITEENEKIKLFKLNNEKILLFTDNCCSILNIRTKQIEAKIKSNFTNVKNILMENTEIYMHEPLTEDEIKGINLLNKSIIKYIRPKRNSFLKNDLVLSADNKTVGKGKIKLIILNTNLEIEEKIIDLKLGEDFEISAYYPYLENNNFYLVYSLDEVFENKSIYIGKYNENNFIQKYIKDTQLDQCFHRKGFFF